MSWPAARPRGAMRILVLRHGSAVCQLARAADLQVVGVTDRGRVVVDGPLRAVGPFTTELRQLIGVPVEVLPSGVTTHARGDHDLARLTPLEGSEMGVDTPGAEPPET